ncbi:GldM family protein [Cytophaga aurantiaca]|uniref:GldM family protein n=1 Tax=Cytophaga aurantiaca TaxID=29530 RepID=UPI00037765D4|nr:GldM family protein [Cytophaga aurantiaca]
MKHLFLISIFAFISINLFAQDSAPLAIYTKSSHTLYRNCSNSVSVKLQLPCDQLKISNDKISFVAGNSKVIIDSIERNQFYLSIIPNVTATSLTLQAFSDANLVAETTFIIRDLPPPSIHIYTGGKEIDIKNSLFGIPKNISIKALPNESITEIFGVDAQYAVTDFEITFSKKGTTLYKKVIKANNIDLTTINSINSADRIIILINEIKILTPEGKLETIRLGNSILVIPIDNSY